MESRSGRSSRSTLMQTKRSFMRRAVSSSSNDSCSMTWHQWHAEYPMESRTGLSSARARSNASSPHGYQSTGLSACWRRYGLVSAASLFTRPRLPLVERLSPRLASEQNYDGAEHHHERDEGERPHRASRPVDERAEQIGATDRGALADALHHAERARAQPRREELGRVRIDGAPGAEVEEADEEERRGQSGRGVGDRERVRGHTAEQEERGQRRLAADPLDEPDRGEVAGELRERAEREEQVHVDGELLAVLQHERKPEEEPVVGDVERDPHEHDERGGAAQPLRDEVAHGAVRLHRRLERIRVDVPARDLAQNARRLLRTSAPSEVVRALRERQPRNEGEERRERRREEEVAPAPVAADLDEEHPGEPGCEQEPDGPEEVEKDEEVPALLRRQVLGQHGGVDDEHAAKADAGEEPERRQRSRAPRERRHGREDGVPEDRGLEDMAAADSVCRPAGDDAAGPRGAGRPRG